MEQTESEYKYNLTKRVYNTTRFNYEFKYCSYCGINYKHNSYHTESEKHKSLVAKYGDIIKDKDALEIKLQYLNKCLLGLENLKKYINNDIKEVEELLKSKIENS